MRNVYWINIKRFDENISKAPRLEIAEHLIDQKLSVTLLTGFRNTKYIPKDYKVKVIYFNSLQNFGLFRISLGIKILRWLINNLKEDDIVIMSPGSLWIGFITKFFIKNCKTHLDVRTLPVEVNDIKKKINYLIFWYLSFRLFSHFPKGFSFITEDLKKSIEIEFKLKFQDYVIWHSGVNMKHFELVRTNNNKNEKHFTITYIGVITKNRGIDNVIQALFGLKDELIDKIIFRIIGDGPYLNSLKNIVRNLDIERNVVFEGYVPYESIPLHIIDTDFFICPLPNRPEWNVSSPIKIFEYLACGRPIILTPIVAHKNIIKNSQFVVWTKTDMVCDIQDAITFAYSNREKYYKCAKLAPEFVKKEYSWNAQGQKFLKYLYHL